MGLETGDTLNSFRAEFLTDHFGGVPLDGKDLQGMRDIEITGQRRARPDAAHFRTAMSFIGGGVLRGERI